MAAYSIALSLNIYQRLELQGTGISFARKVGSENKKVLSRDPFPNLHYLFICCNIRIVWLDIQSCILFSSLFCIFWSGKKWLTDQQCTNIPTICISLFIFLCDAHSKDNYGASSLINYSKSYCLIALQHMPSATYY